MPRTKKRSAFATAPSALRASAGTSPPSALRASAGVTCAHMRGSASFAHVLAASILLTAIGQRSAHAANVVVAGSTRIEARAERSPANPEGVVIRGTLRDDVGNGVSKSHVAIALFEPGSNVALALASPVRCTESSSQHEPHVAPDEYVLDTDESGAFCVHTVLPSRPLVMKVRFQGSALLDGTTAEIPVDPARSLVELTFDPEPRVISLDRPKFTVSILVSANGFDKDQWRVALRDEAGRLLGSAGVEPDGHCRIEAETRDLAEPGPGELRATLEGATTLQGAGVAIEVTRMVERHVRVDLEVTASPPRGDPEEGIPITVKATSSRGVVPSGSVEAALGPLTVGASELHAGAAAITASFAPHADPAVISLRYLPTAPWFEPGPPRTIALALERPSPLRRLPVMLLAAGLAAWMLRRSLPRFRWPRSSNRNVLPKGPATEITIGKARSAREGWAGHVRDAHDGRPIAGATVSIVSPAFPGSELASMTPAATTNADGSFVLRPARPPAPGSALRVEARWHSTLEQPLPSPCELSVPVVARRRALLERLVKWGTREWGAKDWTSREPTPQQIVARARHGPPRTDDPEKDERAAEVQTWARAVENAAFGAAPVDDATERRVQSLEPKRRA